MVALKGGRIVRLRVGPVAPGRRVQRGSRAGMSEPATIGSKNGKAASGLPMRRRNLSPSWAEGNARRKTGRSLAPPVLADVGGENGASAVVACEL